MIAWLLRLGEARARRKAERAGPGSPVLLPVSRWATNEAAGQLFASLGYTHARTFHEMRMELDGPIATSELPDRIAIRTFDRQRDAPAPVAKAWRGRALLLAAFGELRLRGIAAVDLGVDSESQTGATRLYEQVGMRSSDVRSRGGRNSDRRSILTCRVIGTQPHTIFCRSP